MATYVEHTACKVKDLDWCVKFFTEVFDMPIRLSLGEKPNRKIWLHAGIQLNEDITFDEKEGRLDHIMTMYMRSVLHAAAQFFRQGITG